MTIPRELFDRGLDPLDAQVIQILDSDPDQAYSAENLAEKAGYDLSSVLGPLIWGLRLSDLAQRQLVASQVIHGEVYYASVKQKKG